MAYYCKESALYFRIKKITERVCKEWYGEEKRRKRNTGQGTSVYTGAGALQGYGAAHCEIFRTFVNSGAELSGQSRRPERLRK